MRRRIVVSGRVQGVFFRDSTQREAQRLELAGWVRNRPDGTVEAVFEGEPSAVRTAIDYMRKGPPQARVDEAEVLEEPDEDLRGFEVR